MNSNEQNGEMYSNHAQVWRILPWYINGSLSADERQFVALHTTVCLVCRKELGLQRALRDSIQALELDDLMLTTSLDRLSAQLVSSPAPLPAKVVDITSKLVAGVGGWWQRLALPEFAAAAVLVLAMGLGLVVSNEGLQPVNNTFRTLSNASADATTAANLRIIFAEALSTSERAVILRQHGLTAITGPDARGMYYVKSASQTQEARAAELKLLQANANIVFAESVLAAAPEAR